MQTDAVTSTATQAQTTSQVSNSFALDKDAFLKLLVAQLQNQDPMSPMDSNQFIAQMAEFSTVEQLTNIYQTVEQMAQENELSLGASLVGHQISLNVDENTTVTGVVQKVTFVNGQVNVYINGNPYNIEQLTEID